MGKMEKFAVVSRILNSAFKKREVLETSEYYKVFGNKEERERDLSNIKAVISRLLAYQNRILNEI